MAVIIQIYVRKEDNNNAALLENRLHICEGRKIFFFLRENEINLIVKQNGDQ